MLVKGATGSLLRQGINNYFIYLFSGNSLVSARGGLNISTIINRYRLVHLMTGKVNRNTTCNNFTMRWASEDITRVIRIFALMSEMIQSGKCKHMLISFVLWEYWYRNTVQLLPCMVMLSCKRGIILNSLFSDIRGDMMSPLHRGNYSVGMLYNCKSNHPAWFTIQHPGHNRLFT